MLLDLTLKRGWTVADKLAVQTIERLIGRVKSTHNVTYFPKWMEAHKKMMTILSFFFFRYSYC